LIGALINLFHFFIASCFELECIDFFLECLDSKCPEVLLI
jgi:hypothetical protein